MNVVVGDAPTHDDVPWVEAMRAIFDFLRFRYLPEWFLFIRRILRASGLPDSQKEDVYRTVFGSRKFWYAINHYLVWRSGLVLANGTPEDFAAFLSDRMSLTENEVHALIGDLSSCGFCNVNLDGHLVTRSDVSVPVSEYEREVNRDYNSFKKYLSTLLTLS
jgi:hypothetical protein